MIVNYHLCSSKQIIQEELNILSKLFYLVKIQFASDLVQVKFYPNSEWLIQAISWPLLLYLTMVMVFVPMEALIISKAQPHNASDN